MVPSCKNCPYRESGPIRGQSEESVGDFSSLLARYSIRGTGKTLFNQGEPPMGVYFLCQGAVKLTRATEQGDEVIVDLLAPCSVVGGANSVKERNAHVCSAATIGELTDVAFLKNEDFSACLNAHPTLGLRFSQHLSERLREAYKWTGDLKLPVEKRVVSRLVRICEIQREEKTAGFVKISVSRQDLTRFAQTTPETLSRTLRRLVQRGLVRLEKGGQLAVDAKALHETLMEGN